MSLEAKTPILNPKDELIRELISALKTIRKALGGGTPVLDALITKAEMGVE